MKYLVAGGSGFIGSHLCKELLNMENEVICLDNFYTGSEENNSNLLDNKNFTLIEHDIINKIDIKVDGIFNLACPASPEKYQLDPIKTSKTSFIGTLNLLELANKYKIKFLLASTSEVYGDPKIHPQIESYYGNVNCFGPRACYDEGKRIAETLCYDFHNKYNTEIRVPRIFNTYGPKMMIKDGRVITNFISRALRNVDLEIYGNGNQTRSFCYVDDLINGLIKIFFKDLKELNSPINIGNSNEFKIIDLAKKIIELTGSSSKIKYKKLPFNDPMQRKPDIKKIEKIVKWHPKTELLTGLKKTINYIDRVL